MKTKTLVILAGLVFLVAASAAWASLYYPIWEVRLDFSGQVPDEVVLRRQCVPDTLDAVYVARDWQGSVSISVVPGGCCDIASEATTNGSDEPKLPAACNLGVSAAPPYSFHRSR